MAMPQDGYVQGPVQLAKWRMAQPDHQPADRRDGPKRKDRNSLNDCHATAPTDKEAPEQEPHEEQPNTSKDDLKIKHTP